MAKDITVSVKRAGNVVNTALDLRLDNISPIVIAGLGGAIPYSSYMAFTLGAVYDAQGNLLIQQGDLWTDIVSGEQYRASGNPEIFDEDHIECLCEKAKVNTP
jgi:hypothetical protein